MGWRAENAVMVLGAILIGTFGAVLLSPEQLLLGSGALALSEAADAVRHDRAQPAFVTNSMSSRFSVRGSYRGTPTFTLDGVAVELSRAMAISDGPDDTQSLVGIRLSLGERSESGGWRLVERGSLYEVGVDMSDPTRWSKWGTLQLDLPHVEYADLEDRWFVIEHELRVASGSDDEAHIAFTYAHANPSVAQWLMDTFHGC